MLDTIIIFIYTVKDSITEKNLENIRLNNPDIPVYDVCQYSFNNYYYDFLDKEHIKNWSGDDIWRWGSDNIFLYWYLSQNIRAKNYILVEWDTYCHNTSFSKFFIDNDLSNNNGIISSCVYEYMKNPNEYWFQESGNRKLLNQFFKPSTIWKAFPLSCTIISNNCVTAIINFLQKNNPLINKIYVETKFATIAKRLGFDIKEHKPDTKESITYHTGICENKIKELCQKTEFNGIFHPIKNLDLYKYFIKHDPNIIIHKCLYGAIVDITSKSQAMVNEQEQLFATNNLAGDPAPWISKQLYIRYEKNGQIFEEIINENDMVNFGVS